MTAPRALRSLALSIGLALVLLAALELGFRGWLAARGEPSSHAAALTGARAAVAALELPVGERPPAADAPLPGAVPHPYFGWEDPAVLDDYARVAAGMRDGSRFEVVLVGGSLARRLQREGQAELARALADDPRAAGRALRLHYLGHPGFKQPQQLAAVEYVLALGWRPALVVNVDGPNELALGDANRRLGVHPSYPYAPLWRDIELSEGSDSLAVGHLLDAHVARRGARRGLERLERGGWTHSRLLAALPLARIRSEEARFGQATAAFEELTSSPRPLGVYGPPVNELAHEGGLDLLARQWFLSSRMLAATCRAHGVDYVHLLAPAGPDEGALAGAGLERPPGEREALRAGYPRLRELGSDLARVGVAFVDASRPELSEFPALDGDGGDLAVGPPADLNRIAGLVAGAHRPAGTIEAESAVEGSR